MHATGKTMAIVAIVGGLGMLCALPAISQNKVAGAVSTSVVECKEKSFPNLPGQNSFTLKKEKNGTFTAVTESYGKPKTYPYLKCHFHSKERKVFFEMDCLSRSCAGTRFRCRHSEGRYYGR